MTYYIEISVLDKDNPSIGRTIHRQEFKEGTPIENRQAAIAGMKEIITGLKSKELYQALAKLEVVQLASGITGQPLIEKTKEVLFNDYCYSVYYWDESYPEQPMVIESSHRTEDSLDSAKVLEYQRYLIEGYDTGGEPKVIYIPQYEDYFQVLADDADNSIGLRQLLMHE
jgi:hypothetical protein